MGEKGLNLLISSSPRTLAALRPLWHSPRHYPLGTSLTSTQRLIPYFCSFTFIILSLWYRGWFLPLLVFHRWMNVQDWKYILKYSFSTNCSLKKYQTLPANAKDEGDVGSIPGSGRSSGEGNGNPLQYSCLENFMDRGVWWAIVYGVTTIWTQLIMHARLANAKVIHRHTNLLKSWRDSYATPPRFFPSIISLRDYDTYIVR